MDASMTSMPLRFFAAANGASGFRSYFDEIFSSEKSEGVFILKGGPGTGKSTLLRDLASVFDREDTEMEIFHCSSDPKSLDGLYLTHAGRSVCILDGTAPHERDARLPGACDELFDLGACFDTNLLRAEKKAILSLQKEKSLAYKEAYFYLNLFGIFDNKIKAETRKRIDKKKIKGFFNERILPLISIKSNAEFSARLIRAFSSDGLVSLDTYEVAAKEKIVFSSDENEGSLLLFEILSLLSATGAGGYYSPSPFSEDRIDGIFLKDEKVSFTMGSAGIDCGQFFIPPSAEEAARISTYRAEAERFLALAKEALARASESHFALEKIYTPAVDFTRMRPMKDSLVQKIGKRLMLTEFS